MKKEITSPRITSFRWGRVETSDGNTYKDVKLYPGGSREWDWNETGTEHTPGIQPADVQELLEQDAEIIILSKGVNERLSVMKDTLELLEQHNVPYHILQTEQAIETYNDLRKDRKAGALIHSTC